MSHSPSRTWLRHLPGICQVGTHFLRASGIMVMKMNVVDAETITKNGLLDQLHLFDLYSFSDCCFECRASTADGEPNLLSKCGWVVPPTNRNVLVERSASQLPGSHEFPWPLSDDGVNAKSLQTRMTPQDTMLSSTWQSRPTQASIPPIHVPS
jgi:hypothetical protein